MEFEELKTMLGYLDDAELDPEQIDPEELKEDYKTVAEMYNTLLARIRHYAKAEEGRRKTTIGGIQ